MQKQVELPQSLVWTCQQISTMNPIEVYGMLQLRSKVFVLEQSCLYEDMDDLDIAPTCWHLLGRSSSSNALLAFARILGPGTTDNNRQPMIGRVVIAPEARGTGLGRPLMQEAINVCEKLYPDLGIAISAQAHLEKFYTSLGFLKSTPSYDEHGILHIGMQRK